MGVVDQPVEDGIAKRGVPNARVPVFDGQLTGDRVGRRATLITSQLPVEHWHTSIGDPTFGDAILDRLVHHAHRITLSGGSLRRLAAPDSADSPAD